ncbi:pleckstrin domain-containing protein [Heterostelium album PN500]|uniref:Pleckstrin domain-containing protein n=1 Tax=Heterostelium pallidum (strain ATCC 26659 / Pp 5 / PN500) TaxID=670386 RepID=D3AXV4_HETP5|nr:pleckstrin domain-containing protein [Heterostelium album PN500]EFA85781.1 pleckstrin domain-containing protein [Heterostelium album PN500]|eukprot:XP_020437887.1 pleckstrin domain-containing protein [Heterostelium album PN500]
MVDQDLLGSLARAWITRKRYAKLLIQNENRDKVAKEILDTEIIYVRNLEVIVQYYLKPLRAIQPPLVSVKTLQQVFGHIEDLLTVNRELLNSIQDRMTTWYSNKKMGDIFLKLAPYLKMYTEYCSNYDRAISKLKEKSTESKDFGLFLKKISVESAFGLDLTSLLIMPVQRIPRYKLLLQSLIHLTPKEFSDYKVIEEALAKVSEVADHINESIREKQNSEKILSIQRRFTGYVPPLLAPLRTFIREGYLTKVCRKEPKKRWFILFSDALVYGTKTETTVANPIYKFHRLLPLANSKLVNLDDKDSKYKNSFQIIHTTKSFTVFADNEQEKASWIQSIESQLKFLSQNEGSVARMNRQYSKEEKDKASTAPVWIPDSEALQCMECSIKFTTIRRRHHCRRCGNVVCGKCSDQSFKLDNHSKPVRVCKSCFSYLTVANSRKEESPMNGSNQDSLESLSVESVLSTMNSNVSTSAAAAAADHTDTYSDNSDNEDRLISDSLSEIPNITLPALPGQDADSTRSLSPYSGSLSFSHLPPIPATSTTTTTNHSSSLSQLPPIPIASPNSSSNTLPPLPSNTLHPTSPKPALTQQNSLLSFCNFVLHANPNVEVAGTKKPATPSSPELTPSISKSTSTEEFTLPNIKSIPLPATSEPEIQLPTIINHNPQPISGSSSLSQQNINAAPKKPESKRFTYAFPTNPVPTDNTPPNRLQNGSNITVGLKQNPSTTPPLSSTPPISPNLTPSSPPNTSTNHKPAVPSKSLPPTPPKKTLPPIPPTPAASASPATSAAPEKSTTTPSLIQGVYFVPSASTPAASAGNGTPPAPPPKRVSHKPPATQTSAPPLPPKRGAAQVN